MYNYTVGHRSQIIKFA